MIRASEHTTHLREVMISGALPSRNTHGHTQTWWKKKVNLHQPNHESGNGFTTILSYAGIRLHKFRQIITQNVVAADKIPLLGLVVNIGSNKRRYSVT